MLDNKLTWKQNTNSIAKKKKPRLYCLRKLRTFNVHNTLLQLFYTSIISSTLTFGLACWGGNLLKHNREKLNRIIKTASVVIGKKILILFMNIKRLVSWRKSLTTKLIPSIPFTSNRESSAAEDLDYQELALIETWDLFFHPLSNF